MFVYCILSENAQVLVATPLKNKHSLILALMRAYMKQCEDYLSFSEPLMQAVFLSEDENALLEATNQILNSSRY